MASQLERLLRTDVLSWRERKALKAFERREVVYIYHLPGSVGRKTMAQLVEKNLVELVDPDVGKYSLSYGWRLRGPAAHSRRLS